MKKMTVWLIAAAAGAGLLWAQNGGFRFDGPINRIITPNEDQKNDVVIFCFGNPSDSDVEGKIYTPGGSEVARLDRVTTVLASCPADMTTGFNKSQHMSWDGKQNGAKVTSGVYVYQIKAEGLTFTGALLVVR